MHACMHLVNQKSWGSNFLHVNRPIWENNFEYHYKIIENPYVVMHACISNMYYETSVLHHFQPQSWHIKLQFYFQCNAEHVGRVRSTWKNHAYMHACMHVCISWNKGARAPIFVMELLSLVRIILRSIKKLSKIYMHACMHAYMHLMK